MADNRLDLDANLIGYWGFDESLETDNAIDATAGVHHLAVTSAPSVQQGRVGNARQFNGSSTFATPIGASTVFQRTGDLAVIVWARLDSFNSGGSLARALISCSSSPTAFDDTMMWGLFVTNDGRLNYRHEVLGVGEIRVRSAAGVIKTGQIYCIEMRRIASGGGQLIELFVDNVQLVTEPLIQGSPTTFPVPIPSSNVSNSLFIGKTPRFVDSAFWHGLIDEASVHDVARPYQPYLRSAYYRVALRNTTARLTAPNNVLAVSSADMGSGLRWWCYERDKDLYVVKESPFGFFGPDTRLTTTGGGASTLAEKAELIYDPVTDTLLVLFVAGNRIFKLTAQAVDDPASINMPFTADTGTIIKSLDNADGGSMGNGGGQRQTEPEDITYVNRQPVKAFGEDTPAYNLGNGGGQQQVESLVSVTFPSLNFLERPAPDGFGLVVGPKDFTIGGYKIYRMYGGASQFLGNAVYKPDSNAFFLQIPPTKIPQPGHSLDSDVAAVWRFDEALASSNLLDASVNARDLVQTGSPLAVTGQIAGGRQLNSGKYFQRLGTGPDDTGFLGEITIEGWIYPVADPFFVFIYGGIGAGTTLCYLDLSGGLLRFYWYDAALNQYGHDSSFTVPSGVWSHIAARRRHVGGQAYMDLFLNGSYRETFGPFGLPSSDGFARYWQLGRYTLGGVSGLNNQDDTRVSFVARTNNEIRASYANGLGTSPYPAYGDVFIAEALRRDGRPSGVFSNPVVFLNYQPEFRGITYTVGREGSATDSGSFGNGGGLNENFELTYVNRTPVKLSGEDAPEYDLGNGGGQGGRVTTSGTNRPGGVAIEVSI